MNRAANLDLQIPVASINSSELMHSTQMLGDHAAVRHIATTPTRKDYFDVSDVVDVKEAEIGRCPKLLNSGLRSTTTKFLTNPPLSFTLHTPTSR